MSSLMLQNGLEVRRQFPFVSPVLPLKLRSTCTISACNLFTASGFCGIYRAEWQSLRTKARKKTVPFAVSREQEISVQQEISPFDEDRASALVDEYRRFCDLPVETLHKIVDEMVAEFTAGLAADSGTLLKMLPAYLERLPSGVETGCFYALDLGGTNFRVLRAQLGGKDGRLLKQEFKIYTIPPELMVGENDELFDFIAERLKDFVSLETEIHHDADKKRELGFTFSFPVQQHSISSGTLMHWSKGFKVRGTVGRDVVTVLRDAIRRKGLDLEVAALVNDTVGTLAGGRYWNEDVMMGVIVGTGTNACFVEKAEAVPKWKGNPPASGTHVINTEWGDFTSESLPMTFADRDLDRDSVNPGEHIFEKLMSGMYLGEIVRRLTLRLAEDGALFGDYVDGKLSQNRTLTTPDVSRMHADKSQDLEVIGETLAKAWGIQSTSIEARKTVYSIIDLVTQRAARLGAAGIVAVLKKIGRIDGNGKAVKTVVAMDGGMYERYDKFREYMLKAFEELLGKEGASNVVFQLSKDGSGIGAALLAACHSQYRAH